MEKTEVSALFHKVGTGEKLPIISPFEIDVNSSVCMVDKHQHSGLHSAAFYQLACGRSRLNLYHR